MSIHTLAPDAHCAPVSTHEIVEEKGAQMRLKRGRHPVEREMEEIHCLLNKILNPPIDKNAGNEVLARISRLLRTLDNQQPPLSNRSRAKIESELQRMLIEATAIMSSKR